MANDDLIQRLLAGELAEPHSLLGAHDDGGKVVIRAWRPEAEGVRALVEGGRKPVDLEPVSGAPGLFAGKLKRASLPLAYELEVAYDGGATYTVRDPYSFLPTLGELDLHLLAEGTHRRPWDCLGAHVRTVEGVGGVAFAVWAPSAKAVSIVGDFNSWDGRLNPMRSLGSSGIWELFMPGAEAGNAYKYEVRTQNGDLRIKADPLARQAELPPANASLVPAESGHDWQDSDWLENRGDSEPHREPVSIYEVHLGSWRRDPGNPDKVLSYSQLGTELAAYCTEMGFTHIELMPVMAHPFSGSWGYQVTGYFAPDSRHGSPDDLRAFVDELHQAGIGVICDWVPAHFPRDDWALARFDGTAIYEHDDPRRGAHPDWGTLVFNTGRTEVRNFLIASALYWLREMHTDGLRVDAVASMLYLDYSRKEGEWIPNAFGGREDLDAIDFFRELNSVVHELVPGVISAAEESTAFTGVSRPTYLGGLGFGFKWNMGWMHDTLRYFSHDPVYRRHHHNELTFSLMYAFSENFILPLSHDEVVHGKGSIISRMPGDQWQRLANVRALYAYQWAHPGKKLLFMGQEFAQEDEWDAEHSLDWHLTSDQGHAGVQALVRDLNRAYRSQPALWRRDADHEAFQWLEANDHESNVIAFARYGDGDDPPLVCVCNFSPVARTGYRLGLPSDGHWQEVLCTDAPEYGGGGVGNFGGVDADPQGWHGQAQSALVDLPPLGVVWLAPGE